MADGDNDIVLSFNDSLLRKSDLQLLEGEHWLNDKLIGFCFEYFEREKFSHSADKLCLISPDVTQFIKLSPAEEVRIFLEPLNLKVKEYVFMPVNDNSNPEDAGGTHWSLLVYIRCRQEFRHYDSCGSANKEIAKQLAYKIQPFVLAPRGRMKVIEADSPQQQNGYDCGLYVIATAEHKCKELCEGFCVSLTDTVNSTTMKDKRRQIIDLIQCVASEFSGS
ncbi:sentrin-specific protease 8-like [Pecten maximus]|uniref:sentrin-specific protease 8-like n=1 Tax=Pecten maximus TaxID=6579 RepID=UPI001458E6CF|nr:sentrin-specific protease 8-like [Pecten maximus]